MFDEQTVSETGRRIRDNLERLRECDPELPFAVLAVLIERELFDRPRRA